MVSDPYTELQGNSSSQLVLLCEHASERMPEGWVWPESDQRLIGTHWSHDLGAALLTEELQQRLSAPALLSNFTRLLIDPNRPLDSETLFRPHAEGAPVMLNQDLSESDAERRIELLYKKYHAAVGNLIQNHRAQIVFSVHTFTPVYEGITRELEVGVLFDRAEQMAGAFAAMLKRAGFVVGLNQPYSGKDGFAYSSEHHAERANRHALEIEVRQDLVADFEFRARLIDAIASFAERSF